jgi:hypothetical protein
VRYSDLPRLLTMTIVWLLLLVWYFNAYRSGCLASVGLILLFALILLLSGTEIAMARRQAFIDAFLVPGSGLHRLFAHKGILVLTEAVMAALLAVFLLVSALTFAPRQWSLMFADVLLLGLLLPRLYAALEGQVHERYRYATARRWTMWASVVLLWLESLMVLVFSDGHDYMGLRWQEVIAHGANAPEVACPLLADMASIITAVQALGVWSVQNLARNFGDFPQALMATIGVLASVGLSFLTAYVYSRALVGVVGRPWTMWPSDPPAMAAAGPVADADAPAPSDPPPRG